MLPLTWTATARQKAPKPARKAQKAVAVHTFGVQADLKAAKCHVEQLRSRRSPAKPGNFEGFEAH